MGVLYRKREAVEIVHTNFSPNPHEECYAFKMIKLNLRRHVQGDYLLEKLDMINKECAKGDIKRVSVQLEEFNYSTIDRLILIQNKCKDNFQEIFIKFNTVFPHEDIELFD